MPQPVALVRDGGTIASTLGIAPETAGGRNITSVAVMADPNRATLAQLAGQVAAGALRVPVTTVYDLKQAGDAFTAFGAGTLGKIGISCA